MSDKHLSNADVPDVPAAPIRSRRRRFSLVWLVPVVAALIGGWLVVKALTEKGPEITITFKSAEGLEAGKTKVKFKDVEIGQVTEIALSDDLKGVVVKAELVKEAERFLSENTCFWVVRGCRPVPYMAWGLCFQGPTSISTPANPANRLAILPGSRSRPS